MYIYMYIYILIYDNYNWCILTYALYPTWIFLGIVTCQCALKMMGWNHQPSYILVVFSGEVSSAAPSSGWSQKGAGSPTKWWFLGMEVLIKTYKNPVYHVFDGENYDITWYNIMKPPKCVGYPCFGQGHSIKALGAVICQQQFQSMTMLETQACHREWSDSHMTQSFGLRRVQCRATRKSVFFGFQESCFFSSNYCSSAKEWQRIIDFFNEIDELYSVISSF